MTGAFHWVWLVLGAQYAFRSFTPRQWRYGFQMTLLGGGGWGERNTLLEVTGPGVQKLVGMILKQPASNREDSTIPYHSSGCGGQLLTVAKFLEWLHTVGLSLQRKTRSRAFSVVVALENGPNPLNFRRHWGGKASDSSTNLGLIRYCLAFLKGQRKIRLKLAKSEYAVDFAERAWLQFPPSVPPLISKRCRSYEHVKETNLSSLQHANREQNAYFKIPMLCHVFACQTTWSWSCSHTNPQSRSKIFPCA